RHRLETLVLDAAILEVGPAVGRLAASVDIIERHRREIAEARAELDIGTARVERLAARIAPTAIASDVAGKMPSFATRAAIEQALRRAEKADEALEQHREALARQDRQGHDADDPALPPAPARTALRVALTEIA